MGAFQPRTAPERIELASEPEFDIGGMTVKPAERAVLFNGNRRVLQPRVMQVLVALAQARPSVVSREMLIERCWDGRIVGDDSLNRCILALRHLAQEISPPPFAIETVPRIGHRLVEGKAGHLTTSWERRRWPWLLVIAIALLAAAAAAFSNGFLRWPGASAEPPTVLVTGDGGAESNQFAAALAGQLASLQTGPSGVFRLIRSSEGHSWKHDLVLTVGLTSDSQAVGGNAVLTRSGNGTIFWSGDFEQPSRNMSDLKLQIAYAAAAVLRCAAEGLHRVKPLGDQTLGIYLQACAALPDTHLEDPRAIVQMLDRVVRAHPDFAGGWAKLLQAEMDADDPVFRDNSVRTASLKRHIAEARRAVPNLPELYMVDLKSLPTSDFIARGKLLDEALRRNPNHAGLRSMRAEFFGMVGRSTDAVLEAREALRLDPLTPSLRDNYVSALVYSGHFDAALAEVDKSERLWPGSSTSAMARYRVHLRYGDPRVALKLIDARSINTPIVPVQRMFLEARLDPTPQNIDRAVEQVRAVQKDFPIAFDNYAQTLAQFDRKEELLMALQTGPVEIIAGMTNVLFRPAFDELHRDGRFMRAARRIGLDRYWRTTGKWPDFCYAPDLPYDCKTESTKLQKVPNR